MQIEQSVVLVTGAGGGLGSALVDAALQHGAAKVYAGVRTLDPARTWPANVVPLRLDITAPAQVAAALAAAGDVTILINNAGMNRCQPLLSTQAPDAARDEMAVNYFGTLAMCRAFAPQLVQQRGAIVNVLSILARISLPMMGSLCASKAAALRLTDALRAELKAGGVTVLGVLPGVIDTGMSTDFPPPKATPHAVAEAIMAGLAQGRDEIYPDGMAQAVAQRLQHDRAAVQAEFATML